MKATTSATTARIICGSVIVLLSACTQPSVPRSGGNASLRVSDKALPLLTQRAERGDAEAALTLADYYGFYLDNRRKANRDKQIHYYTLAATHGSLVAMHNLVRTYSVDSKYFDISRALYWRNRLKLASERQNVAFQPDQDWYYDLYLELFVGGQGKDRGLSFLKSAAELGLARAQRELINVYSNDEKFRDLSKARYWKDRLSKQNRQSSRCYARQTLREV